MYEHNVYYKRRLLFFLKILKYQILKINFIIKKKKEIKTRIMKNLVNYI